jgi:hypothetical protein
MTRSTWEIDSNAWHARVYRFWRKHAEFKVHGYTVVFWGPLAFLIYGPEDSKTKFWHVVAAPAPFIALFLFTYFVSEATTLSTYAALAGTAFLIALVCILSDNSERVSNFLRPIGRFLSRNGKRIGTALRAFGSAMNTELRLWWLRPWNIALVAAVGLCVWLWPGDSLLILAIVAGSVLGLLGLLAVVVISEEKLKARRREKGEPDKHPIKDTAKLAGQFVKAKKHRICPLIEVE